MELGVANAATEALLFTLVHHLHVSIRIQQLLPVSLTAHQIAQAQVGIAGNGKVICLLREGENGILELAHIVGIESENTKQTGTFILLRVPDIQLAILLLWNLHRRPLQ